MAPGTLRMPNPRDVRPTLPRRLLGALLALVYARVLRSRVVRAVVVLLICYGLGRHVLSRDVYHAPVLHLIERPLGRASLPSQEYWVDPARRYVRRAYSPHGPYVDRRAPYTRYGQYIFPRGEGLCGAVFVADGQGGAPTPSSCPRADVPATPRAIARFLRHGLHRTRAAVPAALRRDNVAPYRGPDVDGLLFGAHGRAVWWLSRTSGAPVALQIMDGPDRGALVRIRLEAVGVDQLPGYFLAPYGPTTLERLAIALRLLPYSRMP